MQQTKCAASEAVRNSQEENPHTQEGSGASLSDTAPYPPRHPRSLHCSSTGSAFVHCSFSEVIPIQTATYLHPDRSLPGSGNQPPPPILL